jgi:hypothetical protein
MSTTDKPKRRYVKAKKPDVVAPSAWARVLEARKYGKLLQDFMLAWIAECRVLDEYHEMMHSLYGENYKYKYFEPTSIVVEAADQFETTGEPHG